MDKVWIPDGQWRVLPAGTDKRCRWGAGFRRPACGAPAVAELNRTRSLHSQRVPSWWSYCSSHLYGRKVEDGQVWILVPADSPAATKGRWR